MSARLLIRYRAAGQPVEWGTEDERGRALAYEEGVTEHMEFVAADINAWTGEGEGYDVIMANQFLHHVVELEQLYDHVLELLAPDGCFVTSDMIGRNGHQRWPEAKGVLDEFWADEGQLFGSSGDTLYSGAQFTNAAFHLMAWGEPIVLRISAATPPPTPLMHDICAAPLRSSATAN